MRTIYSEKQFVIRTLGKKQCFLCKNLCSFFLSNDMKMLKQLKIFFYNFLSVHEIS